MVFADADSVIIPAEVPGKGLLLIAGLTPQQRYKLETVTVEGKKTERLTLSPEGEYASSEAGNLVLRQELRAE